MFARRRLLTNERGAAIIELAIVAPVLALMAMGLVDISNVYSRKLALEQGAQRAIEKIMQTTEEDTVEGTLKAETVCQVNGTDAGGNCLSSPITTDNVTVTYRLECLDGTTVASEQTETDATAFDALTCGAGQTETRYIEVQVVDAYTPMFPVNLGTYTADNNSYRISATAGMRTQ